ncbi:hypothetical protein OS493_000150 [Desmophyllum pertusum]|uniref:Uncharacterized protein n=1 Tax=Desmophyllum pertusum TaxID=174260 RepID=A0A9X0A6X4_9CNID|nr:hypothetical protein OS493_000150 [Desmophyllum pertusum]
MASNAPSEETNSSSDGGDQAAAEAGQFKEATANEIPLPGKKADGVLDFLKKVYGFQYVKEHVEITMGNVEHLLMLSDEYHVKELIFNPCVEFLEVQPKTKRKCNEDSGAGRLVQSR